MDEGCIESMQMHVYRTHGTWEMQGTISTRLKSNLRRNPPSHSPLLREKGDILRSLSLSLSMGAQLSLHPVGNECARGECCVVVCLLRVAVVVVPFSLSLQSYQLNREASPLSKL